MLSPGRIFTKSRSISLIARAFCYKPIKRPQYKDSPQKKPQREFPKLDVPLAKTIAARIKATGPITVASYMKEILTNPSGGYYMTKDVFGREGDFITSPEVGQIFGELVAVWIYTEWQKTGSPKPFQLVELGPGRGTLMQDVLRVLTQMNLSSSDLSVHLVEISPYMCQAQANRLCVSHDEVTDPESKYHYAGEMVSGVKVFWYRSIEDVPRNFSIIFAHEFFDALPVHKLERKDNIWREVLVDVNGEKEDAFKFVMSRGETPASKLYSQLSSEFEDARDHVEFSLDSFSTIDHLAERLEEDGGFSLIMDYGHLGDKTDTFRAFKHHQLHNPLEDPGQADLTADVDFKQLKFAAEKTQKVLTFGPVTQADFLQRLGGDVRLQVLLENAKPDQKRDLETGFDLLTHPDKMGHRFKFFAMFPMVMRIILEKLPVSGFSK
ncbi:protein arginine methyltransferase NDUFAF7 homolog, mitochondrial [Phlebotomus argentipes]|uniref:protein arginine methyltransferase NDUFAF7 homolog, mitochondrial n=1 Tax=Phlebotomus argentipes TaxID=94469 RepID=UPI0028936A79|nr:protein arginine methyltransferase NDUFAF7 homolog, mitochondrial [Phlebotomus argentipes]